jgi:hypothetical protein
MKSARLIAGAAALGLSLAVQAQLKPSGPGTPPLPSPGGPQLDAEAAIKEVAAVEAAERWLALLDKEQYGKAWDECATLFRERVTREQWVESLPKTRGVLGKAKLRRSELSSYKTALPGAPGGEYVSVRFSTSFEKKDEAKELMTMVYEKGAWRTAGYGIQ